LNGTAIKIWRVDRPASKKKKEKEELKSDFSLEKGYVWMTQEQQNSCCFRNINSNGAIKYKFVIPEQ
jgi:hypothetical protein